MYHLFIATPEAVIYDDRAKDLTAPGSVGYFEVLSNHAPLISTLIPGKLEFKDNNDQKQSYIVTGGLVEVDHNHVSVLVDSIK